MRAKFVQIIPITAYNMNTGNSNYITGYIAMALDTDGETWGFTKSSGCYLWQKLTQPNKK